MAEGIDCADVVIGGRVSFAIQNGPSGRAVFSTMGNARINPATSERTAGMTANGKLWVTVAPRPARATVTFANNKSNDGADFWGMLALVKNGTGPQPAANCLLDVEIAETDRGVIHIFKGASIVGFPELDTNSGEITGLEVVSDTYLRGYNNTLNGVASGSIQ